MKNRGLFTPVALLALAFPFHAAHAYTECTSTITNIFSGDQGNIWFVLANGGSLYFNVNYADYKPTLSLGMTALVTGRTVTVRYAANAVACNSSSRGDLTGFWLN